MTRPDDSRRRLLGAMAGLTTRKVLLPLSGLAAASLAGCRSPPPVRPSGPGLALVLGGGAARGFAHVGVIKVLEARGIQPDLVVGTSAGSFVGVLYASGLSGFELQKLALTLDESTFSDWTIPGRGLFKGEAIAQYINTQLRGVPLDRLRRRMAVVATDLATGEPIVFERGDAGTAVRASSAVPGVFSPVRIADRDYVDGGLTHPVPVAIARRLGARKVLAVDISDRPRSREVVGMVDVLLQTFTIMGHHLASFELKQADVVIRPDTAHLRGTDFAARNVAILEGEKAATAALPEILRMLAAP
jgi:NTE family protein